MSERAPTASLRALVAGLVDYAGLFPPAALPMSDAVAAYAAYQEAPEAAMLGRFVVPFQRLDELTTEAARHPATRQGPWRLAVLLSDDVENEAPAMAAFNRDRHGRFVIDVVELKASSRDAIDRAVRALNGIATAYIEIPIVDEPRLLLAAVHAAGARAKVRTGGLTTAAFPSAAALARFIVRCAETGVAFKATAGLHHPIRATHRLTYEPDPPVGTMFGFLNVFAAAAFARQGMDEPTVMQVLEETRPDAFIFDDDVLRWGAFHLTLDQVVGARATFAIAFGSCSFREPVDDLHQLGLL